MSKRKPLLALFMFISLLFGCQSDSEDFTMLASEKTLPDNFEEIAYTYGTETILARKATDQAAFDKNWRLYELKQEQPDVDFNEHDVFFIGVYESGSCASEITRVELNEDRTTMTIPITGPDGAKACTSNATHRTFVIQLEKERTKNVKDLVIEDTNVPFE